MNIRRIVVLLSVLMCVAAVPLAKAQTLVDPEDSSTTVAVSAGTTYPLPDLTYIRPTQNQASQLRLRRVRPLSNHGRSVRGWH